MLIPRIKKAFKKGSNAEARVAAAAMTDYLGKHSSVEDLAILAEERLDDILHDEEWIDSFNDPNAANRALEAQLRKVRKLLPPDD